MRVCVTYDPTRGRLVVEDEGGHPVEMRNSGIYGLILSDVEFSTFEGPRGGEHKQVLGEWVTECGVPGASETERELLELARGIHFYWLNKKPVTLNGNVIRFGDAAKITPPRDDWPCARVVNPK